MTYSSVPSIQSQEAKLLVEGLYWLSGFIRNLGFIQVDNFSSDIMGDISACQSTKQDDTGMALPLRAASHIA